MRRRSGTVRVVLSARWLERGRATVAATAAARRGESRVIVDSAHYVDGARQNDAPLSLDDARRRSAEESGFVWVSLADPSAEEMEQIRTAFELPALAVEDAQEGHQRPKLEQYGDACFIVVKTVAGGEGRRALEFGELDIFLGSATPW